MTHVGDTTRWKFELVVSETMERLGELKQARGKSVQLVHNRQGGCGFTVPLDDRLFSDHSVEPIKHGILASRDSSPIWSGMIWNIDEQIGGGRMGVSGVGWFQTINQRVLRKDIVYPRFLVPAIDVTAGGIVFDDPLGDPAATTYYPGGLLTIANAQRDTWISEGTNTDVMRRVISYERGQNIGEAITSLSDIEAGFDFTVDPLSRVMDISNWDQYDDATDRAIFGFNWAPSNLADFGRQIDASTLVNRMTAMGDYGGGLAEDLNSQATYQLFEEIVSLSGVTDPNVLLGYAGGEVVLRSTPRILYSLSPFPYTKGPSKGRVPQPFVDYNVGSKVIFSAKKPPRVIIEDQAVRVFGITVSITDEGNEKISGLQVTPS